MDRAGGQCRSVQGILKGVVVEVGGMEYQPRYDDIYIYIKRTPRKLSRNPRKLLDISIKLRYV